MSEIEEIKKNIRNLHKKMANMEKIGRFSHLQSKGSISKWEVQLRDIAVSLEDKIKEPQRKMGDIEELKERMEKVERGLQNLWTAFRRECQNRKAS